MERKVFVFGTTVVILEIKFVEHDAPITRDPCYMHRLIIGTIASEWTNFQYLSHLKIGDRMFVGCIDGRAIFPKCFEVVSGLERLP